LLLIVCLSIAIFALGLCACKGESGKDGLSAYELALQEGFDGSLTDWLQSLNGKSFDLAELYDLAIDNGYEGNYFDFVREVLMPNTSQSVNNISLGLLSSVKITAQFDVVQHTIFGDQISKETSGGSGVIYKLNKDSGDAYIITNNHVVYNSSSTTENGISENISVYIYGQESSSCAIKAQYIGSSSTYDIAVLKVSGSDIIKNSCVMAAEIADSESVAVGEKVNAIGNAAGKGISVTEGVISVDSEFINISDGGLTQTYRVMRVDAAINSGNSGGGLFNSEGKIIGIVNAKYNSSVIENIGYAIPSNIAARVADNIIDNCEGKESSAPNVFAFGATLTAQSSLAYYDTQSLCVKIKDVVEVQSVQEGGAAYGKLQQGDIITALTINGKPYQINRTFSVIDALIDVREGDKIRLEILRGQEELPLEFTAANSNFSARK
ncbi:MAG: S1C family serine protease, partial [Clostridia bacterium]|nr:S1C family serine protease [Clostridia bacterium]